VKRQIGCFNLISGFAGKRRQGGEATERVPIMGLSRMQ
jgi:hypothetical protein